jgi:hypothetical protein
MGNYGSGSSLKEHSGTLGQPNAASFGVGWCRHVELVRGLGGSVRGVVG